jgi:hypothetical protein
MSFAAPPQGANPPPRGAAQRRRPHVRRGRADALRAGIVLLLALGAALAHAADRGIYTVVDGDARVLRETTWYRLEAGARAENGDIVDAAERAYVQAELSGGGTLGIVGPALAYMAALPFAGDKAGMAELTLLRGWFKAAAADKARPLLLHLPTAAVGIADGIVVIHDDPALAELFVERGRARVVTPVARGKESAREASAGELWRRVGDRAFVTDDRPSPAFVTAMPRALRDALPSLASHFPTAPASLAPGREITFAECEPWLSGPARRVLVRRFTRRLADPEFRAAAAAAHPIPEWDRTLHPEKYRPRPEAGD